MGVSCVKKFDILEFDLAVREAELSRREAAVRKAEEAAALPRAPRDYFLPGDNADEDDWWAKQLGRPAMRR